VLIIIILVTLLDRLMNFRQVLIAVNADTSNLCTCAHAHTVDFDLFLQNCYF